LLHKSESNGFATFLKFLVNTHRIPYNTISAITGACHAGISNYGIGEERDAGFFRPEPKAPAYRLVVDALATPCRSIRLRGGGFTYSGNPEALSPDILFLRDDERGRFLADAIRQIERFEREGVNPALDEMPAIVLMSDAPDKDGFIEAAKQAVLRSWLEDGEHWISLLRAATVTCSVEIPRRISIHASHVLTATRVRMFFEKTGHRADIARHG